jgi:[protein-PII] uridylyltransferase
MRHPLLRLYEKELKSQQPIAAAKQLLKEFNAEQWAAFQRRPHGVDQLVPERSSLMDQLLALLWHKNPALNTFALIAVGGYGRRELFPFSDIDLLILIPDETTLQNNQSHLSSFLRLLWDMGLKVGHSLRSLEECTHEASKDVTVATSLLESHFIAGHWSLYSALELNTQLANWTSASFFEAKIEEQRLRHEKYEENAYNLEPNLKENPGGLRDIHTLAWVTKFHFHSADLIELMENGFLTQIEYRRLMQSQSFLWRLRFALHMIRLRSEDRLLFDFQRQIAPLLGFVDDEQRYGVEKLMHRYYRSATQITRLNEMLLQLFNEQILKADHPASLTPINRRFALNQSDIQTTNASVFRKFPFALLEIFLLMQQRSEIKGVRAQTIRQIQENLPLINDAFRANLRNKALFLEIIRQPFRINTVLRRMAKYGVLGAYIPAFNRVTGMMQFDLFHTYTVDAHTLMVVRNLRRFFVEHFRAENPKASEIADQIAKPELLYLAGLFHDLAKGMGGEHEVIGAQMALDFCIEHGMSQQDSELVSWLVRYHLEMSITAQKKDIADPHVIHEFTKITRDPRWIDALYLLTIADMKGTAPNVLNAWKNSLLLKLREKAQEELAQHPNRPATSAEQIKRRQEKAAHILWSEGFEKTLYQALWNSLGDDYFLVYHSDEIAWHTQALLQGSGPTQVHLQTAGQFKATQILIYTPDEPFLFAKLTQSFEQLKLNIVDARLLTTAQGSSLNQFSILDQQDQLIIDPAFLKTISAEMHMSMTQPSPRRSCQTVVGFNLTQRRMKSFERAPKIQCAPKWDKAASLVEITATNQPGLLNAIAQTFACLQLKILSARINTIGERAEDTFEVSTLQDLPLEQGSATEQMIAQLTQAIQNLSTQG